MNDQPRESIANYWWVFLLLIPVAFYLGWVASAGNYININTGQPGVGGGPAVVVTTVPTTIPSKIVISPTPITTPAITSAGGSSTASSTVTATP